MQKYVVITLQSRAVGKQTEPVKTSYTDLDVMLYALGGVMRWIFYTFLFYRDFKYEFILFIL